MHEAIEILSPEQRERFCYFLSEPKELSETIEHLADVQWLERPCGEWFDIFNATASQRAEAFGKTLNLW